MQQKVIDSFINNFQLSQTELNLLYGDAPVTSELFILLDKIQQIHSDCRLLSQLGHQTLALDIIEQITLFHV